MAKKTVSKRTIAELRWCAKQPDRENNRGRELIISPRQAKQILAALGISP